MGDFTPLGRVASVVLFPLLLFPLTLSLAAVFSKCRDKIPSFKELVLSVAVLCVQPCLRSAAHMVSCITVGSELVMAFTGVVCYEGAHIAAAVFSWLFLVLFIIFALVGLSSRRWPNLIVYLPETNLLNRLIAHSIVTVIAGADGNARDTGFSLRTFILEYIENQHTHTHTHTHTQHTHTPHTHAYTHTHTTQHTTRDNRCLGGWSNLCRLCSRIR